MSGNARLVAAMLALLPAGIVAKPAWSEEPLVPGYWSFPQQTGKTAEEIDASCRTGFSINFGGGHWRSFLLLPGDRWINDGKDFCTYDEATRTDTCTTMLWQNEAFAEVPTTTVYSTEPDGAIKASTTIVGQTVVSYPVPCPGEAIRDVLSEALSPSRQP
jgi:hypothetical protein